MANSAIMFAVVCMGSRMKEVDFNRLNKVIRKVGVGVKLDPFETDWEEDAVEASQHPGKHLPSPMPATGAAQEH